MAPVNAKLFSKILMAVPLFALAVDQIDDVFAPGGTSQDEVLQAVEAAYDALAAVVPQVQDVPKEAVLQICAGLHDVICGAIDLHEALTKG